MRIFTSSFKVNYLICLPNALRWAVLDVFFSRDCWINDCRLRLRRRLVFLYIETKFHFHFRLVDHAKCYVHSCVKDET